MKVYDLFPFFNELPLLELRMAELQPIVDHFGLVELPRTFTDLPKPLYYSQSGQENPKVRVYVPEVFPSGPHPTVDWFQRAQLGKLCSDAEPDDIIMVSDVDEIPNRDVVSRLIEAGIDEPLCLQSKLYYHRVDLYDPSGPWSGTVIAKRSQLGEVFDAQVLRGKRSILPQIPDAGWHFSWLGIGRDIAYKLTAVDIERENAIYGSHGIQNPPRDESFLQSCYDTGKDMFGRPEHRKERVPIIPGVNQPHEIEAWLMKYPKYAAFDTVPY